MHTGVRLLVSSKVQVFLVGGQGGVGGGQIWTTTVTVQEPDWGLPLKPLLGTAMTKQV